jgi:hypothetical protein
MFKVNKKPRLETAEHTVKIATFQDEQTALAWLKLEIQIFRTPDPLSNFDPNAVKQKSL